MDESASLLISDVRRPKVLFDTSGINFLNDDPSREIRLRTLRGCCYPRVSFTALDEVAGTPEAYRRRQLLETFLRLQNAGDCLLPFHLLLINHVQSYSSEESYDWSKVDSTGYKLEEAIVEFRQDLSDELAAAQGEEIRSSERRYKGMFETVRRNLAEVLEGHDSWSLRQFMEFVFKADGSYWGTAAGLMTRALTAEGEQPSATSEADSLAETAETFSSTVRREFSAQEAREFASECPPFRAMLLGIARSEFSRAHDKSLNREQRRKAAGRIDTYSSIYLPYCRMFVTSDRGQFELLSYVSKQLAAETEVVMYDRLWEYLSDPSFRF